MCPVRLPHEPTEVAVGACSGYRDNHQVQQQQTMVRVTCIVLHKVHDSQGLATKSQFQLDLQRRCPFKYISCIFNMDARLRRVNKEITGMFYSV